MPYGIDKRLGGDNESNVRFVKHCVKGVQGRLNSRTGKPFTKSEAIAICKARLKKTKGASLTTQELELLASINE